MAEVIRKAFTILNLMKPNENAIEWSATELARLSNLNVGTTHRILQVMEEQGIVEQNRENKKFRLGSALMEFGYLARTLYTIRDIARPYLEELAELTKETIYLSILSEKGFAIIVDTIESTHSLRLVEPVGVQYPLYVGAGGKVILAYLPEKERETLISRFTWEQWTINTTSDEKVLREEIKQIKKQGYAVSYGETELGTVGLATPIFGAGGVEGSITLTGPEIRLTEEDTSKLAEQLLEITRKLSKKLGSSEDMID